MSGPDLSVEHGADVSDGDLPRVSVVILNMNGRHHLRPCFESLKASRYPSERLEVVLVDNGSSDGSVEEMRADHPWVKLVVNPDNVGFSAGCNQGARESDRPQVLVFINNDMRVEPDFLRELVSPIVRDECHATAGKMLSWDGKLINSAGGGMNFHGIGIQWGLNEDLDERYDRPFRTLFACGGAMAIDAAVFERVGGFDEDFFAYYEDVDLGWRMWVQGHEVHYAPKAVCYHHHSSTSRRLPREMIRLLQVRNPLLCCFKNYSDENLGRVLPALLALELRRMFLVSGLDGDDPSFRIEHARMQTGSVRRMFQKARGALSETVPIKRVAAADLIGFNDFLGRFDYWSSRRREVQSRRERPDEEIFELFLKPFWRIEDEAPYRELQDGLTGFFGLDRMFDGLTSDGPDPRK